MMEVTKITKYSGIVDEAIEYLVVHGGSQAAAARAKDCDATRSRSAVQSSGSRTQTLGTIT